MHCSLEGKADINLPLKAAGGCLDALFATDCSRSVDISSFRKSLSFVVQFLKRLKLEKWIDARASVALFDSEVRSQVVFTGVDSALKTAENWKEIGYCNGTMTALFDVLSVVYDLISHHVRSHCLKVVFVFSDGRDNSKPSTEIASLPSDVVTYSVGNGESIDWKSLELLASSLSHVICLEEEENISQAVNHLIKSKAG